MIHKRRSRIGDIYEVVTPRGLAYIQHVLDNELIGEFVRILPGFYTDRPKSFGPLVAQNSSMLVSYPVSAASRERLVTHVGDGQVPTEYQRFPLMRAGGDWVWDGQREWRVGEFTEDQRSMPHRATVMHGTLIAYIVNDLTNIDIDNNGSPVTPIEFPVDREERGVLDERSRGSHFLYFNSKRYAQRAQKAAEGEGLRTTLRRSADGTDWLLLVEVGADIQAESKTLERIAAAHRGDYDGWEART